MYILNSDLYPLQLRLNFFVVYFVKRSLNGYFFFFVANSIMSPKFCWVLFMLDKMQQHYTKQDKFNMVIEY